MAASTMVAHNPSKLSKAANERFEDGTYSTLRLPRLPLIFPAAGATVVLAPV
jgi:hypothetical protein